MTVSMTVGSQAQQPPPQSPNMTFFVTSTGPGKGADLGGLEGADRHCQTLAQAAGAGSKTWRAYLSSNAAAQGGAVNARDRIGTGPWQNFKGEVDRAERRRSAQRQQQAQHAELADRARHHGRRRRLDAELARHPDRLDSRTGGRFPAT